MKTEEAFVDSGAASPVSGENETASPILADLYLSDETAWLERMSRLVAERRLDELDLDHLSEFLSDMAKRDRREVMNRLTVLLTHLLKWQCQPVRRSKSWRSTIDEQRDELQDLLGRGILRQHAEASLAEAYKRAVRRASRETGLDAGKFPAGCPWTLTEVLEQDQTI